MRQSMYSSSHRHRRFFFIEVESMTYIVLVGSASIWPGYCSAQRVRDEYLRGLDPMAI
ncbi:hypothetical protein BJY00DRAFT_292945, partial [Aspergillus carlsbadensis]